MKLFILAPLIVASLFGTASSACNSTVCCYPEQRLGCFTQSPPFDDLPLPQTPEEIAPVYWLYRFNSSVALDVNSSNSLNTDNLIVMTHGFRGNMRNTPWHLQIIDSLLKHRPTYDIVFIEWSKGADTYLTFSGYHQAASNTRMIGAMATEWLYLNPKFDPAKSYCIGFSLGAHVCGFMAKHRRFKWQRMTTLDPAGPSFSKIDPRARADKSDAFYMDAIHTSSTEGIQFPVGHVDLWVNNAKHQPGCTPFFLRDSAPVEVSNHKIEMERPRRLGSIIDIITDLVGCSHERSAILFQQSINVPAGCHFGPFCPCTYSAKTGVHFLTGFRNGTCPTQQQQNFGYETWMDRRGSFCGNTATESPYYFCP